MDMVIEDLTISGRNIFPNFISMGTHNFLASSPYKSIGDEPHHELMPGASCCPPYSLLRGR
jgi:hypothetical protein